MPILTDADMVPFRTLFADLACDKSCKIKRPEVTDDGYGYHTETLVVIAETNALIKKPEGGLLQNYAYLVASQATWQVDFPYGQDVKQKDVLDFEGSNRVLVVQEVLEPGSFSISTSVLAGESK